MIKDVKVIPGCISCRNCESVAPEIFHLSPKSQVISKDFNTNAIKILQAAYMCPAQVIKVDTIGDVKIETQKATLISKELLTPDTLELTFKTKDFIFRPGQYVSLQMHDIAGDFSRSYSIASANSKKFTLTVKLLPGGRGAGYLKKLSTKIPWRKNISFFGAHGDFVLQDTDKPKVLIATGTGLAPMIAMLEEIPEHINKTVIFGARFEKDLYYLEKIRSFKNTKLITYVSKPEAGYKGQTGRVTDYLNEIENNCEVYICGNPDMVDSVKDLLLKQNHPSNLVYNEGFTIAPKNNPLWKEIFFGGHIPKKIFISWALILFGLFIVPYLYTNGYHNINYFYLSWYTVTFVMLIRPLSTLFPKIGIFRGLAYFRKAFGIISAGVILTILISQWISNPFTFTGYLDLSNWNNYYSLLARTSEITAFILLITSNNFSQRKLGRFWKHIQRTSYLYFIAGGIIAARWGDETLYYGSIGIWILLYISALIKQKISS